MLQVGCQTSGRILQPWWLKDILFLFFLSWRATSNNELKYLAFYDFVGIEKNPTNLTLRWQMSEKIMTCVKKMSDVCRGLKLHPKLYLKYSKHLSYTVAHFVCSKMINHGLNHGLVLSLFKLIPCILHWIVYMLAYPNFKFEF